MARRTSSFIPVRDFFAVDLCGNWWPVRSYLPGLAGFQELIYPALRPVVTMNGAPAYPIGFIYSKPQFAYSRWVLASRHDRSTLLVENVWTHCTSGDHGPHFTTIAHFRPPLVIIVSAVCPHPSPVTNKA
jgi:hypothetical protein